MKKAFTTIILLSFIVTVLSQNVVVFIKSDSWDKQINIYKDELSEEVIHAIMEDTVFEPWYSLTVYEDSPLRFNVGISTFDDAPRLIGWIDKKHCAVFLRVYDGDKNVVRLYKEPTEQSEYAEFFFETGYHEVWVIGVDLKGRFLNIAFKKGDKLYTGWTKQYCSDYIAGCE